MSPRAWVAMKLIASGVTNWAAMVRSPSFSRSASSTTITNLPERKSSIAASIVENGEMVSGAFTVLTPLIVALAVARSRSTYFASTSASRLTSCPGRRAESVVASSVCGTSATANSSEPELGNGERDAVDRDRALLDAVPEHLRRRVDEDPQPLSLGLDRLDATHGVDVALNVVSAERIARAHGRLDVHCIARAKRPSVERVSVSGTACSEIRGPSIDSAVRQTPLIEIESPALSAAAVSGSLDDQRKSLCPARRRDHSAELPHDPREHAEKVAQGS